MLFRSFPPAPEHAQHQGHFEKTHLVQLVRAMGWKEFIQREQCSGEHNISEVRAAIRAALKAGRAHPGCRVPSFLDSRVPTGALAKGRSAGREGGVWVPGEAPPWIVGLVLLAALFALGMLLGLTALRVVLAVLDTVCVVAGLLPRPIPILAVLCGNQKTPKGHPEDTSAGSREPPKRLQKR